MVSLPYRSDHHPPDLLTLLQLSLISWRDTPGYAWSSEVVILLLYYAVAAQSLPDGQQCSAQGYWTKTISTGASDMTAPSRVILFDYPYGWREHMTVRGQ
jgi:hypothetical protein